MKVMKMKKTVNAFIIATTLVVAPTANADYIASVGFAPIGGDDLVETSGEDLEAGAGIYGDIGILHQPAGSALSYQATFGLKLNFVEFEGGDADITSLPLNFMMFYNNDSNLRFGAGVTYELSPEYILNASSGFSNSNVEFDDAVGFAIEAGYFLNEKAFLGVRYTALDYDMPSGQALIHSNGNVVSSIDANNLGIHIGIMF